MQPTICLVNVSVMHCSRVDSSNGASHAPRLIPSFGQACKVIFLFLFLQVTLKKKRSGHHAFFVPKWDENGVQTVKFITEGEVWAQDYKV